MFNKTKEQLNTIFTLLESLDARLTQIESMQKEIDSNISFMFDTLADMDYNISTMEFNVLEINELILKQYGQLKTN